VSTAPKWLAVQQVADELNLSIETIRNYINHPNPKERLIAAKFGRDWRIKREDLESWIDAHKNVPRDDTD
jgi:excisionase family DNA binding protein